MSASSATFRGRFFRVFIVIGIIVALCVALVISAYDIYHQRMTLMVDARQGTAVIAGVATAGFGHNDWSHADEIVPLSLQRHGLGIVCIYDHTNHLIHEWQAEAYTGHCPALVYETGSRADFFSVRIAVALQKKKIHLGVIYTETPLISVKIAAIRIGTIIVLFLIVAFLVSNVSAYYGALQMNSLMVAIRQQIDCLMNKNASECLLTPAKATRETTALFDVIRNLSIHLESLLVPKEAVIQMRLWYENIFTNLFSLLRGRLPEDSTLHAVLTDCELLLRMHNPEERAPVPEVTDIARLVDEARASARALTPQSADVHLVTSFKSDGQKDWVVQFGYLLSLMRHLQLIGLGRTGSGLISLRAQIVVKPDNITRAVLAWQMEDSGPPMQQGALHNLLLDQTYKIISVSEASWSLAVQITKRMKGTLQGENIAGGLLLKGEIPLGFAEYAIGPAKEQGASTDEAEHPRLILIIGEASADLRRLCALLERFNCRVFWVAHHIQALELAPSLPFSAIILAGSSFTHDCNTAVRRLSALMETKMMPTLAVWAVTGSDTMEHQAWIEQGITQVLGIPVRQDKLMALCQNLMPFDEAFWAEFSPETFQEFSQGIVAQLPEMRVEFMTQIRTVSDALMQLSHKSAGPQVIHDVHAVKSAALALGYMRIALLMANLEHILSGRQLEHSAGNITLIADCLKGLRLS